MDHSLHELPARCQQMLDLLSTVHLFRTRVEDMDSFPPQQDADRVYTLIGSWWSSYVKSDTVKLPRPVVPLRLNLLHRNYQERAGAGEDSEALLRHVVRVVEIMKHLQTLIQQRDDDRSSSVFGDASSQISGEGNVDQHDVSIQSHSRELTVVHPPHQAAQDAVGGGGGGRRSSPRYPS